MTATSRVLGSRLNVDLRSTTTVASRMARSWSNRGSSAAIKAGAVCGPR
jgi:hypothetical protein